MRYLILLLAVQLIAGCATTEETVKDIAFKEKIVKVPVPVPCAVDIPMAPRWLTETVKLDATQLQKSQAILAEVEQRRDYINQLLAAAKKCE